MMMTQDRFNELVNGPLNHPLWMFRLSRLTMALFTVVMHNEQAQQDLERHCADVAYLLRVTIHELRIIIIVHAVLPVALR